MPGWFDFVRRLLGWPAAVPSDVVAEPRPIRLPARYSATISLPARWSEPS